MVLLLMVMPRTPRMGVVRMGVEPMAEMVEKGAPKEVETMVVEIMAETMVEELVVAVPTPRKSLLTRPRRTPRRRLATLPRELPTLNRQLA